MPSVRTLTVTWCTDRIEFPLNVLGDGRLCSIQHDLVQGRLRFRECSTDRPGPGDICSVEAVLTTRIDTYKVAVLHGIGVLDVVQDGGVRSTADD